MTFCCYLENAKSFFVHNSKSLLCNLQNVCLHTWEPHCWGIVASNTSLLPLAREQNITTCLQNHSKFPPSSRWLSFHTKDTIWSQCILGWGVRAWGAGVEQYSNISLSVGQWVIVSDFQDISLSIAITSTELSLFIECWDSLAFIFSFYGRVGSPLRLIVCQYQPDAFESLTIRLETKTPTKIHSKANLEQFSQSIIIFLWLPFLPELCYANRFSF